MWVLGLLIEKSHGFVENRNLFSFNISHQFVYFTKWYNELKCGLSEVSLFPFSHPSFYESKHSLLLLPLRNNGTSYLVKCYFMLYTQQNQKGRTYIFQDMKANIVHVDTLITYTTTDSITLFRSRSRFLLSIYNNFILFSIIILHVMHIIIE